MPVIKWVHLTTDMFDDEKIKLIEKMPDADTLLVIWIKLICQAGKVNDGGAIYLIENVPYDDETLATIFNRPVNSIRLALNTFRRLGMIETCDDGSILLLNWEKHQNINGLEKIRQDTRRRVAKFRERHKQLTSGNVTVAFGNGIRRRRRIEEEEGEKKNGDIQGEGNKIIIDLKKLDEIDEILKDEEIPGPGGTPLIKMLERIQGKEYRLAQRQVWLHQVEAAGYELRNNGTPFLIEANKE